MAETLARPMVEQAYATAILIREVEQTLLALFAEGKLSGTIHTCIGQEFTGVAVAQALRAGDLLFSNHRCHGHFLSRTGNVEGLIAEVMGKESGVCGGRGGSQHLCAREQGFFSNGIQGGIVPVAAGLAMSVELAGTDAIATVFIGDGTLGEGVVYETLNIASKWGLPLLIVLENNRYAQSTSQNQTLAGEIAARAAAFEVSFCKGSVWEPERLLDLVAECAEKVRRERRPALLQADTYRLMAHSKGDDDRDPAEVQSYWEKDPLELFKLESPEAAQRFRKEAESRVAAAVERAKLSAFATGDHEKPEGHLKRQTRWKAVEKLPEGRGVVRLREYEYRCAIECVAAELAAAKGADPELLGKLSDLSQVTCTPEDRASCVRFIQADSLFHITIARLSRNQMLMQAVSEARSQMERIMYAAIDINYYGETLAGPRASRNFEGHPRARSQ